MRKKHLQLLFTVVFAALLGIVGEIQAQDSNNYNYSIKQCIEYANTNSNKVKNALLDEQIATAKVREILGVGLPQVNGSIDVKDFIEIPTTIIPAGAFDPTSPAQAVKFGVRYNSSAGLDASQIIFDGTYFVGLQASRVYQDLSHKATERTKIETAVAVSKAYYSVLVNKERLDLINTNVERLKKLQDDTKAMYDNGVVEKLDYDRVTLNYNNILVEKQKVEQYVALSYYLLKFQIGMDISTSLQLTDKLADLTATSNTSFVEKTDYSKRVEYNLLQTQERLVGLDLKRNQFSRLPSLVAYAGLSTNNFSNTFPAIYDTKSPWYPTALIGAKLTVPIIGGYQRGFKIQQAQLAFEKAKNDRKSLEQAIDLEYKSAVTSFVNSTSALEEQKKNMALANEVYNTSKIKYDQGVGLNVEVINAEASLKEAQTNYYNALYDALVAKIDLDKATGSIKY